MIPLKRAAGYVCLAVLAASAQTRIDLQSQGKNPMKTGTVLPAACSVGDLFVKTDNTPGQNLYLCTSANAWTMQGSAFAGVFSAVDSLPATCTPGTSPELVYLTAGTPGLYQCTAANTWSPSNTALVPGTGLLMVCTEASCTLAIDPAWPGVTNTPPGYAASSTTSLTVGTGPQTLTTQSGLAYSMGASVILTSAGSGAWMFGVVTSYSGTTMALNVTTTAGIGTYADWTINLSANPANAAPVGTPNQVLATDPSGALTNTAHLRPLVPSDLPSGYPWMSLAGVPSTFSPSRHAATHQNGGADEIATLTPTPYAIPKAGNNGKLAQGWIDLTGYQSATGSFPWSQLTGVPSFSYQSVQANGAAQPQRPAINFIPGTNIAFSCSDNGAALRTDCTVGITGLSVPTIPSAAVLKGSGGSAVSATSSDVISLWTGSCSSTTFLRGDGSCAAPGSGGGSGGTVTSVGLILPDLFSVSGSPVSGAGTLTATLVNQTANTVLAGPSSGSPAPPAFRPLILADLPSGYQYSSLGGLPSTFPPSAHAATHQKTGADPLSLDASQIATGVLPPAVLPSPTSSTLGGVNSYTAVAHQWINGISTAGAPSSTQPSCADLSNAAPSCSVDTTRMSNITGTLPTAQGGSGRISTFAPLGINTPITQPADTTLDTLATLTIPANSLGAGSRFHVQVEMQIGATGSNWTGSMTIAGTSIGVTLTAGMGRPAMITADCTVYSSTSMECLTAQGNNYAGIPGPLAPVQNTAITITTSSPIPIALKGQNASVVSGNAIVYGFAAWPLI